jgi:hypothetical protein
MILIDSTDIYESDLKRFYGGAIHSSEITENIAIDAHQRIGDSVHT